MEKKSYFKKFIDFISNEYKLTVSSLDTHTKGRSARKLSAFVVMILVVIAHVSWLKSCFLQADYSLLEEILIIDYIFVLLLLGIVTMAEIIKLKNKAGQ